MLANLVGAFIAIFIAASLFPVIQVTINEAITEQQLQNNYAAYVLSLIPRFFVIMIVVVTVPMVYSSLNQAGLIPHYSTWFTKENKEKLKRSFMSKQDKLVYDIKPMYSFNSTTQDKDTPQEIKAQ